MPFEDDDVHKPIEFLNAEEKPAPLVPRTLLKVTNGAGIEIDEPGSGRVMSIGIVTKAEPVGLSGRTNPMSSG